MVQRLASKVRQEDEVTEANGETGQGANIGGSDVKERRENWLVTTLKTDPDARCADVTDG